MACRYDEDGRVSVIQATCRVLSTNPLVSDPFVELDIAGSSPSFEIRGDASETQVRLRHGRWSLWWQPVSVVEERSPSRLSPVFKESEQGVFIMMS